MYKMRKKSDQLFPLVTFRFISLKKFVTLPKQIFAICCTTCYICFLFTNRLPLFCFRFHIYINLMKRNFNTILVQFYFLKIKTLYPSNPHISPNILSLMSHSYRQVILQLLEYLFLCPQQDNIS